MLTGAEGAFCAGADLKAVAKRGESALPPKLHAQQAPMGPTRLLADRDDAESFVSLSKPLIAAIEGHAVAGGLELALMADMRVASETAVFGVYCRRWGVPLIDGGTLRLPRVIGQGRAMDMILTGRAVEAPGSTGMGARQPSGQTRRGARRGDCAGQRDRPLPTGLSARRPRKRLCRMESRSRRGL